MQLGFPAHSLAEPSEPRLLLVEDADGMAGVMTRVLERAGLRAERVVTGEAAMSWLVSQQADLMLLDYGLPDMTGQQLVERLRASGCHVPFVIITGRGDARTAVEMMKLGALDYLVKDDAFLTLLPSVVSGCLERIAIRNRLNETQQRLFEREAHLRRLSRAIEQSPSVVVITDTAARIEYVNPAFCEATGYSESEAIGSTPQVLKSGVHPPDFYTELWSTITSGHEWRGEFCNRRKSGELFWERVIISPVKDSEGRITHYLKLAEDVTARKSADETIRNLTYYDALTGLPNPSLFRDNLGRKLPAAQRAGEKIVVALLDIDHFHRINNAFAHGFGDLVLKEVAERLESRMRPEDLLARFWGDSFLVALCGLRDTEEATRLIYRLLQSFTEPFVISQREVALTASVGMAAFPHDGTSAEVLVKNAEAALARGKEGGPGNLQLYAPAFNVRASESLLLHNDLRKGIERGELTLYYQPHIDARQGRIVGAEALVRWNHPVLGLLFPDRFIPLAEETNLIVPLGEWVAYEACRTLRRWADAGHTQLTLAINLSPRQFQMDDCASLVTRAATAGGCVSQQLVLEITEGLILRDTSRALASLGRLKEQGCQLAIDDFGTGYSSLSYLQKYPLDIIKIDKSFVFDCDVNQHSAALTRAIIAMARGMGLRVLAEGVEKPEHVRFLCENGCSEMQGYHFSRPLPLPEFEGLLPVFPRPGDFPADLSLSV